MLVFDAMEFPIELFFTKYAASAPSNSKTKLKPSVPSRNEVPAMGLTSGKNFITSNAVEAILSKPGKVPQEPFQWTTRPGYGEVPMYLRRNKLTMMREKESFEEYVKMRSQPVSILSHTLLGLYETVTGCRLTSTDLLAQICKSYIPVLAICLFQDAGQSVSQLSLDDRAQLLLHLKRKWGSVNHAFQGFSLAVDSEMKKHRREELERQLAEIERDIKMLERGQTVLVVEE